MTVTVDPLPLPPGPSQETGGPGDTGAGPGVAGDTPQLPAGWTEADLASLLEIVRGPYEKIAELTGDPSYKLTKIEELVLVGTFTTWMPVSWVRAGAHGQLPLIVALPVTVLAIGAVTLPKIVRWNATHPEDQRINIPFLSRKEARRARPRSTEETSSGPAAGAGPADLTSDRVEPQPPGTDGGDAPPTDGGPPADSIADIRRAYSH